MFSIRINASAGLENFFARYPQLFEEARETATNKSLDLLQETAFRKAPYKTGTLRREIKQLYSKRMLVAGTHQSRPYAYVQEFGNSAGTLRGKRYFYGAMEEKQKEVLDIFSKEFRRALSGK